MRGSTAMPYAVWLTTALLATLPVPVRQPANSALVSGLKSPSAVAVGVDRRVYVCVAGASEADGALVVLDKGKVTPFATSLGDPRGVASFLQWLYVADRDRVWR